MGLYSETGGPNSRTRTPGEHKNDITGRLGSVNNDLARMQSGEIK